MTQNCERHWARIGIVVLVVVAACAPAPSSGIDSSPSLDGQSAGSGGVTGGGGAWTGTAGNNGGDRVDSGGAASGGVDGGAASARGGSPGSGGAAETSGSAGSGGGGAQPSGSPRLPVPPGPADVPRPSGAPGNITVLDWAGFKGAVSYTFDDSNSSQIMHYAELQALGVPVTFYMWTARPTASDPIWATVLKDGHEIGNHSEMHVSNGTGEDLDAATMFIKSKWGVVPWTMAAPNGAPVYTKLAKGRFFINRGTKNSIVLPNDNSDPFTLPCYYPPEGAAASVLDEQVDSARAAGGWRIFLIHGFTGGSDRAFKPVPFKTFADDVKYTKAFGDMWIGRVDMVGAYWVGQKIFSQAMPTTAGAEKTWKWTLPDHFPPGRLLRVTVPGGKLMQGGTELAWDGHGYYEVALDAGSVTLSP
jgi:peptidoglycan/xylan/chitin deacetylase (PgdA/CDA1 family)